MPRRLGQRQLQVAAAEGVGAVADPVGPRHQQLAAPAGGHLVLGEAVDQRAPGVLEHPQRGAALGHHGAVAAGRDLELVAAGSKHGRTP